MSDRKIVFKFSEEKAQEAARKALGLKPIVMGYKNCLGCERKFFSVDVCVNRLCVYCAERAKRQGDNNVYHT
jgi:hypothetical protein